MKYCSQMWQACRVRAAAVAAALLAGCAVVNPGDSGDAVKRVEGYQGQANAKIGELEATCVRLETLAGKCLEYSSGASALAAESDKFPEGFEALLQKKEYVERRESELDTGYSARESNAEFAGASEQADQLSVEIEQLFEKARKSIIVRHIADREAKRRNLQLWTQNKERKDAIWRRIENARKSYRDCQGGINASRQAITANLGKLRSILASMPEAFTVQCFDENDREIHRIDGKGRNPNDTIARPEEVPVKDDWHVFKYWSASKNGEEYKGFGRDTIAQAPRKLWAVFEEKPVVVAFYADEGDKGSPYSSKTILRTSKAVFEKPEKDPSRWGYRFIGWKNAMGGAPFAAGGYVTDDATFVGVWEESPFEVTFHDADGSVREVRNIRLSERIPAVDIAAEGYDYLGWSREKGGKQVAKNATLKDCMREGEGKLDLYAIREPVAYKATFLGRDGAVLEERPGSAVRKVSAPKAKDIPGYRFEGWFADGRQFRDGPITGNVTVEARYAPIEYKATFVNAATGETIGTERFSADRPLTLPEPPHFRGFGSAWSMKEEGKAKEEVNPKATSDIRIYAVRTVKCSFWNWSQKLCEEEAVYGSTIRPPSLIDRKTGKALDPEGWGFSSNESKESFIDFAKFPMETNRLEFRAVWPQSMWGGPMPDVVTSGQWKRLLEDAKNR